VATSSSRAGWVPSLGEKWLLSNPKGAKTPY